KVLVSWNALMLAAFAEAGRYLQRPDYTQAAIHNATFLLDNLYQDDRLLRSWRAGQSRHNAYLEDYAGLALGLMALYQTDPQVRWYTFALQITDEMIAHFSDPNGGFFDTRDDHGPLLLRPKDIQDNATPSGNALAALALLQIAAYGDRPAYRDRAEAMLSSLQDAMTRYPTAFAQWLCAADFALGPIQEIAIVGPVGPSQPLIDALWNAYRPRLVAAISPTPPQPGSPALLQDRPLQNDQPTAYVCQGFVCRQPVNTPTDLCTQLHT
ncbi:MAG: thioredoxin domain-containing protein, partial [Anaerolineales bacterium]